MNTVDLTYAQSEMARRVKDADAARLRRAARRSGNQNRPFRRTAWQ